MTPLVEITLKDTAATHRLALAVAQELAAGDLLILTGELGAGKTTFTRSLGEGLGVRPGIISPTFVLSRIHPNLADGPRPGGPDLVHVDAYRLTSAEELDDLDLESSLEDSVTVIEWGKGKAEHLSDSRLEIEFLRQTGADDRAYFTTNSIPRQNPDNEPDENPETRQIRIRAYGPRWSTKALKKLKDSLI